MAALRFAPTIAWVIVKVLFAVVAVPLILIFIIASFGAMLSWGQW